VRVSYFDSRLWEQVRGHFPRFFLPQRDGLCGPSFDLELTNIRPVDGSDISAINHSSQEIISRLGRIEDILTNFTPPGWDASENSGSQPPLPATPQQSSITVPSPHESRHNHGVITKEDLLVGQSYKGLSRLVGQPTPKELIPLARQDGEDYLNTEIRRGEDLFLGPPPDIRTLDLHPKTCWHLQQCFATHVLPYCPLIDQHESSHIVTCTCEQHFPEDRLDTCLTLFILALGAIANAKEDYKGDNPIHFAGLGYFQLASTMISNPRHTNHSILAVQCRILQSFYYLFTLRTFQAFDCIHIASLATLNLLEFEKRLDRDEKFRQHVYRAYWACYLTEHELQAVISYSSCLLQLENEFVPLPSFDNNDEPGSYWFLSEIAFRKIFANSREGFGWNSFSIHQYAVIQEIDSQLAHWYDLLPNKVKFPKGLTNLVDMPKVFLRGQYYAIVGVLHWPAIVHLLTLPLPSDPREAAALHELASRCLEYLIDHVHAVESLLTFRHLLLHANITGLHCVAYMLVCTYNAPKLKAIQRPDHGEAVRKAWSLLRIWRDNPVLDGGVGRLEELMLSKGLLEPLQNMPALGRPLSVPVGVPMSTGLPPGVGMPIPPAAMPSSAPWSSPELRFKGPG
jgi:hypothetical protein